MEDDLLGAVRIKDGLFLGDALAAWDVDFLTSNGVCYIVNASDSSFDYGEVHTRVLQLNWPADTDVAVVAGPAEPDRQQYTFYRHAGFQQHQPRRAAGWGETATRGAPRLRRALAALAAHSASYARVKDLLEFIEDAEAQGLACLVHSHAGKSRAVMAVCIYLIMRYSWTTQKALEFVLSRRPDLDLRKCFVLQLLTLEGILAAEQIPLSSDWLTDEELEPDELLMRNTFRNSLWYAPPKPPANGQPRKHRKTVTWQLDAPHSGYLGHPASSLTPRERNDASMHWSIPSRQIDEAKKSSEDLTVEIPLTVHPSLRAKEMVSPASASALSAQLHSTPARLPKALTLSGTQPASSQWRLAPLGPPSNIWPAVQFKPLERPRIQTDIAPCLWQPASPAPPPAGPGGQTPLAAPAVASAATPPSRASTTTLPTQVALPTRASMMAPPPTGSPSPPMVMPSPPPLMGSAPASASPPLRVLAPPRALPTRAQTQPAQPQPPLSVGVRQHPQPMTERRPVKCGWEYMPVHGVNAASGERSLVPRLDVTTCSLSARTRAQSEVRRSPLALHHQTALSARAFRDSFGGGAPKAATYDRAAAFFYDRATVVGTRPF